MICKQAIKQARKSFATNHGLELPNVAQLQIMLSPSVNTSPVELSYTFLEMVASKRRNHPKPENLETLLLLLALQVPVRLFFVINLKSSIWKHRLQNFIFTST